MAGIKDYSTTNLNNTSLNGISVAEGMLPSQLNNAIRALMVNTRSWYNDSQWVEYGDGDGAYTAAYASATSFTIAGVDVTPIYHEGRRIKLTAATPGTIYGTISSSTFSTDTTINVTWDSGSLSNEAISNVYIGALSKTNNSLPTGVIATATLADGSVTTIKIADSAVTTAKINDAAVTNAKLGADSVNGSKIADDSIDSEHYVDGSIDTAHIADSQITTAKIANSNVTTAKIADSNVTTAKIADSNVTTAKIANLNVTNGKIAADAVDGTKIADDSIDSEHYVDGSIDTQHIADSQITTAKVADSNITTAKIADSNVTTAKIADSNITTAKINNDAVTADKIADAVIVTNAEASGHTPNDTTFFTTSASDGRYFRQDSSETIASGDTWSGSDSYIATTAAIDARIIDLVDDVGGFVAIANEDSFPTTNPDINDGTGTIVSIADAGGMTYNTGTGVSTDAQTTGGATVTINSIPAGIGSPIPNGYGMLVETTSTLNTYTFHRLVPIATEVTTVAGISGDITTVAGISADVTTVAGISADVSSVAAIDTDVSAVAAIDTNVTTVADNITDVNTFAVRYRIGATNPTTSLDEGDLFFNTTDNELKFYNGSAWSTIQGGISNVVDDTTPQLGGNLDLNSNDITGTGDINITGTITATTISGTIGDVVDDTTPQLGGDLDLNSSDVTGTGNVNITGTITSSGDITTSGVLNSIAPTRHSIRPSLNLDFANSKVLDPRITFTRASNATYYDGYTSVKAEENLLSYSQEFDNWIKIQVTVTANDTTAPDGTLTADKIVPNSGFTNADFTYTRRVLNVVSVSGNDYVMSVYAKAGTRNLILFKDYFSSNTFNNTWFDLSTGTVGTTHGSHTASIEDVGNGWYRCSIKVTASVSKTNGLLWFAPVETDGTTTVTDDQGFIYLWGAQFEQRDSLTAYTPTTSSPITKYQPALQTAGNNVARFDHNPTTGESLGLLIEEQRTNLMTRSEEANVWGIQQNMIIESNVAIAPDGLQTADKIIATAVSGAHYLVPTTGGATVGQSYTYSIYAKASGINYIFLQGRSTDGYSKTYFDLSNGVVSNAGIGYTNSITPVGNGWYRCAITFTADTAGGSVFALGITTTSGQEGSLGNGFDGVYFWGAQLEQPNNTNYISFPTSYIKTTGSTVTRSKDKGNIDVDNWFNQNEGTFYANASSVRANGSPRILSADDNWLRGFMTTVGGTAGVSYNSVSIYDGANVGRNSTTTKIGEYFKAVTQYNTTSKSALIDGGLISTGTRLISEGNDLLPVSTITISDNTFNYDYCGTIKKISYYPIELTTSEIQDLTEE